MNFYSDPKVTKNNLISIQLGRLESEMETQKEKFRIPDVGNFRVYIFYLD